VPDPSDALSHAPLARRQIDDLKPSTPTELDAQFAPASAQLSGANPDPALVQQRLVDLIEAQLGHDEAVALAASFDRQHPTAGNVFDLGDVSDSVATPSGYACLLFLAN
jgi:hypothetical protein